MHFAIKLFFFAFAVHPGTVYYLVDFYVRFVGWATQFFGGLAILFTEFVLVFLQEI